MFAIYNEEGRSFRNTLEELYRVESLRAAARVRQAADEQAEEVPRSADYSTNEALKAYRKAIQVRREETIYHAYQIMKKPVVAINLEKTLEEAYALMLAKGFRQLPVLAPGGSPAGMLTLDRILEKGVVENGQLYTTNPASITEVMAQPLIAADPLSDIRRIAKLMYDLDINSVPITNEADQLVGIVTRTDIVLAVSRLPGLALQA